MCTLYNTNAINRINYVKATTKNSMQTLSCKINVAKIACVFFFGWKKNGCYEKCYEKKYENYNESRRTLVDVIIKSIVISMNKKRNYLNKL